MSIAPTLRGASRRAAQAALAASRGCAPGGDQILPRALLHRAIRPNNCDEGPRGFTDAATVLPVQVFLWADAPERAFVERTSAAIMVLLAFLIVMNLADVLLRRKFERRW